MSCYKIFIAQLLLIFNVLMASEPTAFIEKLENHEKQNIVMYGTSLTCGPWVKMLDNFFNNKYGRLATVTNSGCSGMCSEWGVENLDEWVIKKQPDAVFIEFAINDVDLYRYMPTDICRSNLENMIERILEHNPFCDIILMTMNPPSKKHLTMRPYIEDYYQVYRDVAKERNLLLVDLYIHWRHLLENDPKIFDEYIPDGIHPNREGSKNIILPVLIKALYGDHF